jgi:hypothetical protein
MARTMNPRHATAVLLIAFGSFALLVGCIGGGVGFAQWASQPQGPAGFFLGWLACTGVLPLLLGATMLVSGVRLYRASDHRLQEVRDKQGRLVGRAMPVLSPLWLATFALLTFAVAVLLLGGGLDASTPQAVAVAARYGPIVMVFVTALAGWAYRRMRGRAVGRPAGQGDTADGGPGERGGTKEGG